jgi:hypothetical protein
MAGDVFSAFQVLVFEPYDDSEAQNAGKPLPDGCVAARRVNGTDPVWGLPAAQILCETENRILLLVVMVGQIATGGDGADASAAALLDLAQTRAETR